MAKNLSIIFFIFLYLTPQATWAQKISVLTNSDRLLFKQVDYRILKKEERNFLRLDMMIQEDIDKLGFIVELPKPFNSSHVNVETQKNYLNFDSNWNEDFGISLWEKTDLNPCINQEVSQKIKRVQFDNKKLPYTHHRARLKINDISLAQLKNIRRQKGMLGFKQLSIIENYFQSEEHLNKNFVLIIFDQVQNEKQIFIPTIKMAINKDKIDFPLNLKLTNNNLIIEKMNIWGLSPNQKISFYQYPELVLENHIELPYNIRNQFEEFKEQAIQYTFRKNGHKYPLLSYSDDMQICQSKKCHDGIKNNWSKELNIKTMFPKEKKIRVTHYILNRPVAHLLKNAQFHLVPTTEILPKARYFVRNYFSKKTYCPKADYYFSRIEMLKESSQQNYVNLTGLKKTIQPLKNEEKSANSDWFNQVLR